MRYRKKLGFKKRSFNRRKRTAKKMRRKAQRIVNGAIALRGGRRK